MPIALYIWHHTNLWMKVHIYHVCRAYKDRFKMTATGKIRYVRPGHVHKRFNKGSRQLQELGQTKLVQDVYARIMKRLGFKMRRF